MDNASSILQQIVPLVLLSSYCNQTYSLLTIALLFYIPAPMSSYKKLCMYMISYKFSIAICVFKWYNCRTRLLRALYFSYFYFIVERPDEAVNTESIRGGSRI